MKCDKHTMLLYAVTDRAWTGRETLRQQVEDALKGGVTCVQLREKELDDAAFLQEAMELSALCRSYGVPFIINDNVDIAIQCHADGIHVGQEDMAAADVRAKVGPACRPTRWRRPGWPWPTAQIISASAQPFPPTPRRMWTSCPRAS